MGFFNKLKTKLFTLDGLQQPDAKKNDPKTKQVVVDNNSFKKGKLEYGDAERGSMMELTQEIDATTDLSSSNNIIIKSAAEIKLDKKIEKERIKRLKEQNKLDKYTVGLKKSGSSFSRKLKEIQTRYNNIDEDYFEELEEVLIMSDISVELSMDIIVEVKKEVKKENVVDLKLINEIIADKMFAVYANQSNIDLTLNIQEGRLNIILMTGVNGAGKTTSIAKIAHKLKEEGKSILIAAADTFRAGAVEQLDVWAKRLGVGIVKPHKHGADPSSVVYDALEKVKSENYDVLMIDTAGRLQNKVNLMNELSKMHDIIKKAHPDAPHESLLVIDATTGQNGVSQANNFKDATNISGIVLTKMDGTSKGGIVLSIKDKLNIPVKLLGLGEKIDDLQEFDLEKFIYCLTEGLMDGTD